MQLPTPQTGRLPLPAIDSLLNIVRTLYRGEHRLLTEPFDETCFELMPTAREHEDIVIAAGRVARALKKELVRT